MASGLDPVQIDGEALVVVFGGRVRSTDETPIDGGTTVLRFLDAGSGLISEVVRPAANEGDTEWRPLGFRP